MDSWPLADIDIAKARQDGADIRNYAFYPRVRCDDRYPGKAPLRPALLAVATIVLFTVLPTYFLGVVLDTQYTFIHSPLV